jgi:CDP-2,3-bis-(O-geranylgeranyl)-sn-glycerol synthase
LADIAELLDPTRPATRDNPSRHVDPARQLKTSHLQISYIVLMHSLQIGKILILLMIANGAPLVARKVFGDRWSWPLDAGKIWHDGRPVLGVSKTVRGVICSIVATMIVAPAIGVSWTVGLAAGAAAMAGDLSSSFVKRRLELAASERATGLDQVPESFPTNTACPFARRGENGVANPEPCSAIAAPD